MDKIGKIGHTLGFICKESIDLAGCSVVSYNGETFVVHVEDQILTLLRRHSDDERRDRDETYHDGQANKTDVTTVRTSFNLS